jgi:hypothetical protein
MKRGGAIGLIVLLVALVIVMMLVAESWRSVAPEAIQISDTEGADVNVRFSDHGESHAVEELRRGDLPDLQEMRQRTDAHARQVEDALDGTNQ